MNLKKALFFAIPAAGLMVTACGDETNVTEVTEKVSMDIVATGGEKPNCSAENTGEMIFVTDSSRVYLCDGKKWNSLNVEKDSNGAATAPDVSKLGCLAKDTSNADNVSGFNIDCAGERVGTIWNGKDAEHDGSVGSPSEPVEVTTEFLNQDMLKAGKYETFLDTRDNKLYRTIKIGDQIWFAQNLDFTADWIMSYCYDNKPENCIKYGRLYSWADANNLDQVYNYVSANTTIMYPNQGVCPNGWHIPTEAEWAVLETVLGDPAGTNIKSSNGWKTPENGTPVGVDKFGFSAVGAGFFNKGFLGEGERGSWWTSTEAEPYNDKERGAYRGFKYNRETEEFENSDKLIGHSVRCVKD